jgi:prevent-host-death family protein
MLALNFKEAQTDFSRMIDEAANGKSFVITKSGKPVAKVIPFTQEEGKAVTRLGFMNGEIKVPDDFDRIEIKQTDFPSCS